MYLNFVNDRRLIGYKVVKDTNDGIKLVLITDRAVILIRNLSLNLNGKSKRIIGVISFATLVWFSNPESGSAIPMSSAPVMRVQPNLEDSLKNRGIGKDRISYQYFSKSKEELLLLILCNGSTIRVKSTNIEID